MTKKVETRTETRTATRSEDDIDNTIKSITRKVQVEDLVKEGRTKNLKMIKESQLRKILSTIMEKLISERDVELSDKERELALLQSQSILSSKSQREEMLNDASAEQGKLQEQCNQLQIQLTTINQEKEQYVLLLQKRQQLIAAINEVLEIDGFLVAGSEIERNAQQVNEASSIDVATQILVYIRSYVASQGVGSADNKDELSTLQIELEATRELFDELKGEAGQERARLEEQIKNQKQQLIAARELVQAAQEESALEKDSETEVITQRLANVTSVKDVQSAEIKGLVEKVKKLEAALEKERGAQAKLSSANDRIQELRRSVLEAKADGEAKGVNNEEHEALLRKCAALDEKNKDLTDEEAAAKSRIQGLEKDKQATQSELAALQKALKEAQDALAAEQRQVAASKKPLEQAGENEEALKARVKSLEAARRGLNDVNQSLEDQVKELKDQLEKQSQAQAAETPSLPKVKNRNRRPSALAHMDGDQRGSNLLLNGSNFDFVKRSGSKEGGAWRIYRKQADHSLKAVSGQPFKEAPSKANILATWRIPSKNGERLLLETEDGHISIQGGDAGVWNGRLDQLLNSKPGETSGVAVCLDTSLRQSHLVWCDEDGRLVHVVDVNAHYLTEHLWHVLNEEESPNFVDCATWYRSQDETLHVVALSDDDDMYHFTSTDKAPWQMQVIDAKSIKGIQAGSLCAYAPGDCNHLLLADDNGQLHEFWSTDAGWNHETIGMTADSLPCAKESRPIGGYTNDRHVIAYCNSAGTVNALEFTDEWRSVQLENTNCIDGAISAQFYGGEARLAWRDEDGIKFSQRTDEGWNSSDIT